MLDHHTKLLRAGAVSHALYQQTVNPRLRPGHLYTIKNGVRGLLYLACGPQVKHDPLNFRFMRNVGRAQLESYRIAYLFGDMHRFSAVAGNPGWERVQP